MPHETTPWTLWIPRLALLVAAASCGSRFSPSDRPFIRVDPPPPPPPLDQGGAASFTGLGGLDPLDDGFAVRWTPLGTDGGDDAPEDFVYEIYLSVDGAPFDFGTPEQVTSPAADSAEVRGLATGTVYAAVVRAASLLDPTDVDVNEVALTGVVAPFLYVDVAAGAGGTGESPASPLPSINEAVIKALGAGQPTHVLIAGGVYEEQVPLFGNVHLHGAWPRGFDGPRDRVSHPTILRPAAGAAQALRVLASDLLSIVDSLELDGQLGVDNGIEHRQADLQLSNTSIFRVTAEGLTASGSNRTALLRVHRVQVVDCGTEGFEASGSFRCEVTSCRFERNGNEGVEFDDLAPQPGELSLLWLRDCLFAANGDDGLDVDLNELEPDGGGSSDDGVIEVVIERCVARDNALWGLIVDQDYDQADDIEVRALLRGNCSERNVNEGMLLDADLPGLFVAYDNRTSANRGGGVAITSDVAAATVYLANHWDLGSGEEGVRVLGPVDCFLSHVGVTGSRLETLLGNGITVVVDSAFWQGPIPTQATVEYSYSDPPVAGAGNLSGPPEVLQSPLMSFFLDRAGEVDRLFVPEPFELRVGQFLELDEDGIGREVIDAAGPSAQFEPAADRAPDAGTFVAVYPDSDVTEDPRVLPSSPWVDAGDPGGRDEDDSPSDIGILGGRLAGFQPTPAGPRFPFLVERFDPGPGTRAGPLAEVVLRFTRVLDSATVTDLTLAITVDGAPAAGSLAIDGDKVTFAFDQPLASGMVEVAVRDGLRDQAGEELHLPARYRIEIL